MILTKNKKSKVDSKSITDFKKSFDIDDAYSVEKQYFQNDANKEYRVYKISAQKATDKNLGVLEAGNFYFIFNYDQCCQGDKLNTRKINGWVGSSHGVRTFVGSDPFTPPEGDWNINFMGPSGSTLISRFRDSVDRAELQTFAQWSREGERVSQHIWPDSEGKKPNEIEENKRVTWNDETYQTIRDGKKFTHEDKLVGGSVSRHDQVMNIYFSSDEEEQKVAFLSPIVDDFSDLGLIYARNGSANLKEMLSTMHELGVLPNLVMNSCRQYYSPFDSREICWHEKYNQGPTIANALNLEVKHMYIRLAKLNNHDIAYQFTQKRLETWQDNINEVDAEGNNALYYAVKQKNYDLVGLLLDHDARLISHNNPKSLLVYAIDKNDNQLFDIAINNYEKRYNKATYKQWNDEGVNAFKKAWAQGDFEKVKAIDAMGVQLGEKDIRSLITNKKYSTFNQVQDKQPELVFQSHASDQKAVVHPAPRA
ncbi:ankyrin repeat domain-containing protein [Thiotrichales bacterium 19X7-9]|nr:ankyrin repeat domain-containing protein [Thiotrichales bacterium 19X7-9]